jgi:hypothetical protein
MLHGMLLKSSTRTIRIDDVLDKLVEKSANEDSISVNSLVNKALQTYLEWDVVSRKFGLSTVPRSLLNRFIEHHSENECKELGHWIAKESFKPFAEYQFGQLTFQSSLEVFRRFAKYGGLYEFDTMSDSHKLMIFLKHGSGRKWSIYYSGLVEAIYRDMLGSNVKIETTDELCLSQVELVVA